jgi:two-component system OmpR family sensor kinase
VPSSHSIEKANLPQRPDADAAQRIAELEEAVAARDAFIAVVAHELRNPMTPILGSVQRLQRLASASLDLPGDFGAALQRLEWLIDRYIRRATTLLDVSRIRAGKHSLTPEPIDFAEALRGVVETVRPAAQHMRSAVVVEAPPALPGICDRLAFEQIGENIVTNALKYGAGHPVRISLRREGETVELAVEDAGPGISAADRKRIFERFERVIENASKAGGFGIGLWVVRQLVDAMAGTIELESEAGRGSRFVVRLPVKGPSATRSNDGCAP